MNAWARTRINNNEDDGKKLLSQRAYVLGFIFIRMKWMSCAELLLRSAPRASHLRHTPYTHTHTPTARTFRGWFHFSYEIFRRSHWKIIHPENFPRTPFNFSILLCLYSVFARAVPPTPCVERFIYVHHPPRIYLATNKIKVENMYNFTNTLITWLQSASF